MNEITDLADKEVTKRNWELENCRSEVVG
jgi:hypothetical protein